MAGPEGDFNQEQEQEQEDHGAPAHPQTSIFPSSSPGYLQHDNSPGARATTGQEIVSLVEDGDEPEEELGEVDVLKRLSNVGITVIRLDQVRYYCRWT
jgi:hypothetical protein